MPDRLVLALIHEVFHDETGAQRLRERLARAREMEADLAVLPELPLNRWAPATPERRDEDAEAPGGPRALAQADAARAAGIGLVGGAIVRDPDTGRRHNTALIFDGEGELVGTYRKRHLPEEPGFLETSHYAPGDGTLEVIDRFALPLGVQICSDVNRPQGTHCLAAAGARLVVAPRATESATWPRWRAVLVATALTAGVFVASVNRPGPEAGVAIGGPSIVVDPNGEVVAESDGTIVVAALAAGTIDRARRSYPGYLAVRSDLYARDWTAIAAAGPVSPLPGAPAPTWSRPEKAQS